MSYHEPLTPEIEADGLDGAITSLQSGIKSSLPWIDKVFHRAYLFDERDEESRRVRTVPKCYQQGNEYISVLPNDHVTSQLFFIPTGDEEIQDYDSGISPIINQDIALVFWCDVRTLSGNSASSYSPTLAGVKKELMNFLNNHDAVVSIVSIVDRSAEDVFEGFTINDEATHYTMLPFAGLRINFRIQFMYKPC